MLIKQNKRNGKIEKTLEATSASYYNKNFTTAAGKMLYVGMGHGSQFVE